SPSRAVHPRIWAPSAAATATSSSGQDTPKCAEYAVVTLRWAKLGAMTTRLRPIAARQEFALDASGRIRGGVKYPGSTTARFVPARVRLGRATLGSRPVRGRVPELPGVLLPTTCDERTSAVAGL